MKGSGTKEERYLTLIHFHGGHFESRRFSVNSSRFEVNSSAATTSPRSAKENAGHKIRKIERKIDCKVERLPTSKRETGW